LQSLQAPSSFSNVRAEGAHSRQRVHERARLGARAQQPRQAGRRQARERRRRAQQRRRACLAPPAAAALLRGLRLGARGRLCGGGRLVAAAGQRQRPQRDRAAVQRAEADRGARAGRVQARGPRRAAAGAQVLEPARARRLSPGLQPMALCSAPGWCASRSVGQSAAGGESGPAAGSTKGKHFASSRRTEKLSSVRVDRSPEHKNWSFAFTSLQG
jgi:hypothetical protein